MILRAARSGRRAALLPGEDPSELDALARVESDLGGVSAERELVVRSFADCCCGACPGREDM